MGRSGGIGRRKGLKIPRWKHRAGSIPVSGTKTQYRGIEQLVARRAHNPEAGGSSPPPATIRIALESHDSEASFLLFRGISAFGSIRFYSVLDRLRPPSLGGKWASNAKIQGRQRSSRRRRDDESGKKDSLSYMVEHIAHLSRSSLLAFLIGPNVMGIR